eukprot:3989125-Prymnesium_polylepis.2
MQIVLLKRDRRPLMTRRLVAELEREMPSCSLQSQLLVSRQTERSTESHPRIDVTRYLRHRLLQPSFSQV